MCTTVPFVPDTHIHTQDSQRHVGALASLFDVSSKADKILVDSLPWSQDEMEIDRHVLPKVVVVPLVGVVVCHSMMMMMMSSVKRFQFLNVVRQGRVTRKQKCDLVCVSASIGKLAVSGKVDVSLLFWLW